MSRALPVALGALALACAPIAASADAGDRYTLYFTATKRGIEAKGRFFPLKVRQDLFVKAFGRPAESTVDPEAMNGLSMYFRYPADGLELRVNPFGVVTHFYLLTSGLELPDDAPPNTDRATTVTCVGDRGTLRVGTKLTTPPAQLEAVFGTPSRVVPATSADTASFYQFKRGDDTLVVVYNRDAVSYLTLMTAPLKPRPKR